MMNACLRCLLLIWIALNFIRAEDTREQEIWAIAEPAYLKLASEEDAAKRSQQEANVLFSLMRVLNAGVVLKLEDVISYAENPDKVWSPTGAGKIYLYEKISDGIERVYMVSVYESGRVYSLTFNNAGANNFSNAIAYVGDKPRPPAQYLNRKIDSFIP